MLRPLLIARWPALVGLLILMGILALATGAYGVLVGPMLRTVFGGPPSPWPGGLRQVLPDISSGEALAIWMPALIVGTATVKGLATYALGVGQARLGQGVIRALRAEGHGRLMQMPPDAVTRWGTGDLMSRLTRDAEAVESLIFDGYARLVRDGLQALVLLLACVALSPTLAAIAFGLYPLVLWPMIRLGQRLRRAGGDTQAEHAALNSLLHRQIERLPLIQLVGVGGRARARLSQRARAVEEATITIARLKGLSSPLMEILGAAALAGTIFYATDLIAAGELKPEAVLSFFACLLMLYQPVKGITRAQAALAPGLAALDRLEALARHGETLPRGGDLEPPPSVGEVRLERVWISRGGQTRVGPIDGRLRVGEIIAVTGPNGAGKSSLLMALAGLAPVVDGAIFIEGIPLEALRAESWRRSVGWLTQDAWLTAGTIADNVTMGRPADEAHLSRVAELSDLGALLRRLPQGWQTELEEGGRRLSGGERQRVALARALVADPPVLVLDEPDAHLDAEGRGWLRHVLPRLCQDRVVILIAHDPTLIEVAHGEISIGVGVQTSV